MVSNRIKFLHWNVNGIRSIIKKDINGKSFEDIMNDQRSDILVFTETKISEETRNCHSDVCKLFSTYPYIYHTHALKKGYSGVSVYSKIRPIRELRTFDDDEGRLIVLEFELFIMISVYVPNSGAKLARLNWRTEWDKQFRDMCKHLSKKKSLVILGDLNVAHMDIDICHPEKHHNSAGFTDDERGNFDLLLRECNLLDCWRIQHEAKICYTYFDYRTRARERNAGWRIDYVLISSKLENHLLNSAILNEMRGSDHVPVVCTLSLTR